MDPLATPGFFPMRIDAQRNTMLFVQMSKESLRQSVFLDRRAALAGRRTLLAEIPKLRSRRPECPLHMIVHGAFCGSTLLARYFEQLPHCLVLKEPNILGQLSGLKNSKTADLWDDWFTVSMTLLSRGFPSDVAVVIKTPDLSNWMCDLYLDYRQTTRIIFLHSSLRIFLLQALKVDHRRLWIREHIRFLGGRFADVPFLSNIALAELTDGQRAAAMWLMNSFFCSRLLARADHHRVLVMDADDFISRPELTFFAAAEFLGLLEDQQIRAAIEHIAPIRNHSKDADLAYDASTRATEIVEADSAYGHEVRQAMSWADQVSSGWVNRGPFPVK
jgi:hypothetical protein